MTRHEVVVDTAIAESWGRLNKATDLLDSIRSSIAWNVKNGRGVDYRLPQREQEAEAEVANRRHELRDVEEQYEGWSRFFLVQASGGHIHRDMSCSTCFPTTQYAWLPELSGLTEAEAVEEYGEILCSICYPSAPVEWTRGENKKHAAQRDLDKALKAIAKSPEGKKVKSATELVASKAYRIDQAERRIARLAEDVEHGREPLGWVVDEAARAEADLPKLRKQLERAEAKLAEAEAALEEALS